MGAVCGPRMANAMESMKQTTWTSRRWVGRTAVAVALALVLARPASAPANRRLGATSGPLQSDARRTGRSRHRLGLWRVDVPAEDHRGAFVGHHRHGRRHRPLRLSHAGRRAAQCARLLRHQRPQLQLPRGPRLLPSGRLQRPHSSPDRRASPERQRLRQRAAWDGVPPRHRADSSASRSSAGPAPRSTAPAPSSRSSMSSRSARDSLKGLDVAGAAGTFASKRGRASYGQTFARGVTLCCRDHRLPRTASGTCTSRTSTARTPTTASPRRRPGRGQPPLRRRDGRHLHPAGPARHARQGGADGIVRHGLQRSPLADGRDAAVPRRPVRPGTEARVAARLARELQPLPLRRRLCLRSLGHRRRQRRSSTRISRAATGGAPRSSCRASSAGGRSWRSARSIATTSARTSTTTTKAPTSSISTTGATRGTGRSFAQDEIKLHEKVLVNLGLRHDHYDTFGGTTNPRVGPDLHAGEQEHVEAALRRSVPRAERLRAVLEPDRSRQGQSRDCSPRPTAPRRSCSSRYSARARG